MELFYVIQVKHEKGNWHERSFISEYLLVYEVWALGQVNGSVQNSGAVSYYRYMHTQVLC